MMLKRWIVSPCFKTIQQELNVAGRKYCSSMLRNCFKLNLALLQDARRDISPFEVIQLDMYVLFTC